MFGSGRGRIVLMTDRDRIVAELRPPTAGRVAPDALLADAVRRGLITPATLPPVTAPVDRLAVILAALDDARRDR
jgi:hypothetical protein